MQTKFHLLKAMVFPVVMYGCESWTIKKAEHWRIDAFELWCWKRLLRAFCTARRSNQSILKEISPEYPDTEAEAPIPWPSHAKSQLVWKDPDAGKDWRQEEKGTTEDEMVWWPCLLNGHKFEKVPGDGKGQGSLSCYSPWGCKDSDMAGRLNNNDEDWTTAISKSPWSMSLFLHSLNNLLRIVYVKKLNFPLISICW